MRFKKIFSNENYIFFRFCTLQFLQFYTKLLNTLKCFPDVTLIYKGVPSYLQVIRSKTYHGYVKP
jgi:hypothetical protein